MNEFRFSIMILNNGKITEPRDTFDEAECESTDRISKANFPTFDPSEMWTHQNQIAALMIPRMAFYYIKPYSFGVSLFTIHKINISKKRNFAPFVRIRIWSPIIYLMRF